jgi:hypothetical protein
MNEKIKVIKREETEKAREEERRTELAMLKHLAKKYRAELKRFCKELQVETA